MDATTTLTARIRAGDLTGAECAALADLVEAVAAAQHTTTQGSCIPAQAEQAWSKVSGLLALLLLTANRPIR